MQNAIVSIATKVSAIQIDNSCDDQINNNFMVFRNTQMKICDADMRRRILSDMVLREIEAA